MTGKIYLDIDVQAATKKRMHLILSNFQRICVAFSGGKDSSVLLHLALQVSNELGLGPVHVLFIDLEGQYQATISHVKEMLNRSDVKAWWVCLPLNLRNASSFEEPYWCAWEPGREADWIRPLPQHPSVVSDPGYFPFFRHRMEFEEFVMGFNEWIAADGIPTAVLVGIRSDESLNRYLAIKRKSGFKKCAWTPPGTKDPVAWSTSNKRCGKSIMFFPIYDWRFEDLWKYTSDNQNAYNRIYDHMYRAGVSFPSMRICQPYGDDQRKGLDLFHKLEPQTWFRVVNRVAGANYAARYCRQRLLGYRGGMGLPTSFSTWKQYSEFLLLSMPTALRDVYLRRIKVFIDWWSHKGYPIYTWPDAGQPELENKKIQPSWRRIAMSLIKQDMARSLSLGHSRRDTENLIERAERKNGKNG